MITSDPRVFRHFLVHVASENTQKMVVTAKLVRLPGLFLVKRESDSNILIEYGPFTSEDDLKKAILNMRRVKGEPKLSYGWADGRSDHPYASIAKVEPAQFEPVSPPVSVPEDKPLPVNAKSESNLEKPEQKLIDFKEKHKLDTEQFVAENQQYFDFVRQQANQLRKKFSKQSCEDNQ